MNVIAYDPFITDAAVFEADGVKKVDSLEDLYRQADFLSLHIRLRSKPAARSATNC
ncbi:MAG: NAD(P)-dependent oxidoreductase [Alistipes onderdonkii]